MGHSTEKNGWFRLVFYRGSTLGTTVVFNCTGRGLPLTVDGNCMCRTCTNTISYIVLSHCPKIPELRPSHFVFISHHVACRALRLPVHDVALHTHQSVGPPIQDIHATSLLYRTAVKRTTPVLHYQTGYQLVYIGIQ